MNSIGEIGNTELDGLEGVSQLQLGSNNLGVLDPNIFNGMIALRSLSLDSNRIVTLNEKATPWNISLVDLNLAGNEITSLNSSTFYGLKTLRKLDLSENYKLQFIKNDTFVYCYSLTELDVTDTKILNFNFPYLPFLTTLILQSSYCPENLIRPGNLGNKAPSLETLNLQDNVLMLENLWDSSTNKSTFFGLQNLSRLDLSRLNRSTFEPLSSLTEADLSHNPFVCNCDLKWLPSWLKGTSMELLESRDTTCLDSKATLEPFRGKQLITFDPTGDCDANIILYSSLTVVAMVLILILGLIYYQRWWIRYRLFLLKLCFVGYEEIHDDADREEYEADDEWVDQHLRPALVERLSDFNRIVCGDEELMLGMYYLDAVHYATERSFKTIFVISRDALRDQ
ncbi:leucine-rich repeat-containing protein 4-like [Lytechinus pictus]|uniref:leucine-rich repeat-containing protein 4-like n=1 Tax=Lytechinus pictus TaxID=7653 RepID=UPI0030B9F734